MTALAIIYGLSLAAAWCIHAFVTRGPASAFQRRFDAGQGGPNTNTGPATFQHPTLASGCEARPPEGTSGCGTTGHIAWLRMVGNGENTNGQRI